MSKADLIAKEISETLPTFLRHMFPYVFEPIHLPPSQILALVSIEERGSCTLGQLKKEMHVTAPTITGIIDRLERDGYVKRISDLKDRRVTNVILTKKGKGIIKQFRTKIMKRWQYILTKMPIEVGDTVLQTLKRMTKGFKDGSL